MATLRFRGDAAAVAQVDTLTVGGTIEAGDKFSVTIGNKTITVSATTTVVATTATEIYTALAASTIDEFLEITWANPSDGVITATAVTAGVPFVLTAATTESDGSAADAQTFSKASTTASAGPNHWDTAANWDTGAVPTTGDDVYIENSNVDILYGFAQTGVTLASLNIAASYTGRIGNPDYNGDYWEYRDKYLAIKSTVVNIGKGPGSGSPRIKLDLSSAQTTVTVYSTGSAAEVGLEALLLKGTHASNAVYVYAGSVGIAVEAGQTSTVATLTIGYKDSPATDADVRLGSGVTLTTVAKSGGKLEVNSNFVTLTQTEGETRVRGSATLTTANLDGGILWYESSGTLTTANVGGDATINFSRDMRSRTVTNSTLQKGAALIDPYKTVTFTNPFLLDRCAVADVALDLGQNLSLQRS